MSIEAYKKTQQKVESPRVAEYRQLGELTARLMTAQKKPEEARLWADAVVANQQFWSRLRIAMLAANTGLPDPLRLELMSLAEWVERESIAASTGLADLESLIAVNHQIMDGLKPFTLSAQAAS